MVQFLNMDPDPKPSSYGSRSGKSNRSLRIPIRIHNTAVDTAAEERRGVPYSSIYFIVSTCIFEIVLRSRITFIRVRLQVKVMMRFRLLPHYIQRQFSSYFININRTESNAQDSFNICFNFSSFSNFCLAIQKGRSRSRIKIFTRSPSRIKMMRLHNTDFTVPAPSKWCDSGSAILFSNNNYLLLNVY
jgi:hypothetical protein